MRRLPFGAMLLAVAASSVFPHAAHAGALRPTSPKMEATSRRPETYGIDDYTVTSLSDLSFTPASDTLVYVTDLDTLFRYSGSATGGTFFSGAVIPAGAVIDWIGLGTCDAAGAAFTVVVFESEDTGASTLVGSFDSTAHVGSVCGTDYNAAPLSYQVQYNARHTIQVVVQQKNGAPTDGSALFSGVEIWWHRSVSPAPAVATFNDVPTGHPFFQYIEALAASGITGGCGNNNYCPDAPLTRGQMAVFLSKALGLHFPGNPPQ